MWNDPDWISFTPDWRIWDDDWKNISYVKNVDLSIFCSRGFDPRRNCNLRLRIWTPDGDYIGEQHVWKLNYTGYRVVKNKDRSIYTKVLYPDEWHHVERDWPSIIAYWRVCQLNDIGCKNYVNELNFYNKFATSPGYKRIKHITDM